MPWHPTHSGTMPEPTASLPAGLKKVAPEGVGFCDCCLLGTHFADPEILSVSI